VCSIKRPQKCDVNASNNIIQTDAKDGNAATLVHYAFFPRWASQHYRHNICSMEGGGGGGGGWLLFKDMSFSVNL